MVACYNVEGREHGLLDFHAPTKALFNLQVSVTEGLNAGFVMRRRLVGEPGFEKMRVVALNMMFSVTNSNCLAQY